MFDISENSKLGFFLVLAGISSYCLAIILLFDRSLLMIANICFLFGMGLLIGLMGMIKFFLSPRKIKASFIFFLGFLIILLKFALIGGIL